MKILLTGFEPFDKSPINPSGMVVRALEDETIKDATLSAAVLPVDLEHGPAVLRKALMEANPEAVICLGQASRRTAISIERIAINLLDFRIPDNAGNQVKDRPVLPGGPAAYFTTLPVRAILERLRTNGIPAELSLSAGTYLCNQVAYIMLDHLQNHGKDIPAGFIHLPALPEQAAQTKGSIPSMNLETMIEGIRIVIQVITGSIS